MKRLLLSATLLLSASAFAQTTVDITTSNGLCSYATGPVSTGTTAGHLQASASSQTGPGCGTTGGGGSGAVTFGPASPLAPKTQTLSTNTGTVGFTFQPLNATSCIGSITGATGGSFTGGTTLCDNAGATSCNQSVSAPATFTNSSTTTPATYNVSVTCVGAASSQATSTATITVPQQGGGGGGGGGAACTRSIANAVGGQPFTALSLPLSLSYTGLQNPPATSDPTSFNSWFITPWPGYYGLNAIVNLPTTNYVSLKFTVPQNFFTAPNAPHPLTGNYTFGDSGASAAFSITLSTACGDFSNPSSNPGTSTVLPGCYFNKATDGTFIMWSSAGDGVHSCQLTGGTTYYLNFINADVSAVTPTGGSATSTSNSRFCPGGKCSDNIVNGTGNWSGYVPGN